MLRPAILIFLIVNCFGAEVVNRLSHGDEHGEELEHEFDILLNETNSRTVETLDRMALREVLINLNIQQVNNLMLSF